MEFYDCNIHLDKFQSPISILNENYEFGVKKLVSLCDDLKEYLFLKNILKNQRNILIGIGFHPNRVYNQNEISGMEYLMMNEVFIFGECGLDFSNKLTDRNLQLQLFMKQLKIAESKENSVLIIHSRGTEEKIIDTLDSFKLKKIIFHWYSGDVKIIKKIVDRNYFFSYNMVITYYKKYIDYIDKIPLERLLLESDAPFSYGCNSTQPEDFQLMTLFISKVKNSNINSVNRILNDNFNYIFEF